jgi:hypothetical protein
MHPHLIDWYRQIDIIHDSALANSRWDTGVAYKGITNRQEVVILLKHFLGYSIPPNFEERFTTTLVAINPEFPVSNNKQELRMMAGVILTSILDDKSAASHAVALGLKAATFPTHRSAAIQPAIITEAELFLMKESARLRPGALADFTGAKIQSLATRSKAISTAESTGDDTKIRSANTAYRTLTVSTTESIASSLSIRIEQIAEESNMLWWLIGGYCYSLNKQFNALSATEAVFAIACDMNERIQQLPAPPAYERLIYQAIASTIQPKATPMLCDYISASDSGWRKKLFDSVDLSEVRELVPIFAAIEKYHELEEMQMVEKLFKTSHPDFDLSMPLEPNELSIRFYSELIFVRAISAIQ